MRTDLKRRLFVALAVSANSPVHRPSQWVGRAGQHYSARARGTSAAIVLLLITLTLSAHGAVKGLYTPPSPDSKGGIQGSVSRPTRPIEKVLAIPADAPERAYEGTVTGSDSRSFTFEGLPMRRYDLVVVYEDRFCEGFTLLRGDDTLTPDDRKAIEQTISKAEPFFTRKIVHRLEGETGRGGMARAICTFLRDKSSIEKLEIKRQQHRRTFKLVILQQVGPGWQIVTARDLYPRYVQPGHTEIPHYYCEALSRIRVTNKMKMLEQLDLTGTRSAAGDRE